MSTARTILATSTALLLLGLLSACGGDTPETADEPTPSAATSPAPPEGSSAEPSDEPPVSGPARTKKPSEPPATPAQPVRITIEDFTFSDPGAVSPGARITVENVDAVTHTVTADEGAFDVSVGPGETVTFTAPTTSGDYGYYCRPHPGMTATLTVG